MMNQKVQFLLEQESLIDKKSQGQFKIHLVSTGKEFNLYQDLKDLLDDTNINIRLGFTCLDRIQNLYQYIKGHIIIVNNSQPQICNFNHSFTSFSTVYFLSLFTIFSIFHHSNIEIIFISFSKNLSFLLLWYDFGVDSFYFRVRDLIFSYSA